MAAPVKAPQETDFEMQKAVAILPLAIQEEFVQLPAARSRWIQERVRLAKEQRLAELEFEQVEARLGLEIRASNDQAMAQTKSTEGAKAKKLTVDEVESMVMVDPQYAAARRKVIDATAAKERAAGWVESFGDKRDMLVSLGADLRAEKEGDPSIRDRGAHRRS